MSTLILPVDASAPHYDVQVVLEGATYLLELRWNERSSCWSLSIQDAAGEQLVSGRRIVLGANLLGRSADPRLPPGAIVAVDSSGTDQEAGRDDLGGRVQLFYIESTGS